MKYSVAGRFWINKDGRSFLGEGKITLLKYIRSTGSILQASKEMKMSYKAAWDDVKNMNEVYGEPLVISGNGKRSGSSLSNEAVKLLDYFETLHGQFDLFMHQMSEEANSFNAKIVDVDDSGSSVFYKLDAQGLGLYSQMPKTGKAFACGDEVSTLIFPNSLILALPAVLESIQAENVFRGKVAEIHKDKLVLDCQTGRLIVHSRHSGFETKPGMELVAVCTAHDIWIY